MTILRRLLLPFLATTCIVGAEIPPFTRIALMGDSITALNGDASTYLKRGLWTNMAANLNQQAEIVRNGGLPYFAQGGIRVRDVQSDYLPQVLASNAEACFILAGTNDGDTVESVAAVLKQIAETLADHGITPIVCDVLPISPGLPERSAWLVRMKGALKAICDADPRFIHMDWFNVLDANNDGVIDDEGYYVNDGAKVHPDADGMSRLGAYAARIIAPYLRPRTAFPDEGWISQNLALSSQQGSRPQGWSVYPAAGTTVGESLTPRNANLGNWWQLSLTGGNAVGGTLLANWIDASRFAPGDVLELVAEFETDGDVSADWNLQPSLISYPSLAKRSDANIDGTVVTNQQRVAAGVLRTPPLIVPAGSTDLLMQMQISGTGTFRLGRTGIRRIPLTYQSWITSFPDLADKGPDADPDGDGSSNRQEWILGGDPGLKDSSLTAQDGPVFTFRQTPRSLEDCTLALEFSKDLKTWNRLPVAETAVGAVSLHADLSDPGLWHATAASAGCFFRLAADWKK